MKIMHKNLDPQQGFFPQPVYLIGTTNQSGKCSFATITWVTSCSGKPPMLMVAITKKTYSNNVICETKKFSANLMTSKDVEIIKKCGTMSGYDTNKIDEVKIDYYISDKLKVPVISSSPWIFECKVDKVIDIGNSNVFIALIENIIYNDSIGDTDYGKLDIHKLSPVIYSPFKFYELGKFLGSVE